MKSNINSIEITKRIMKYLIMGTVVGIVVRYIPEIPVPNKELILISMITSMSYALLDMVSPSIKNIN
tara:strand:- start:584 stop:784 length:201 start_codon:yes stop_codon:yes gene_type:complete